MKLITSLLLCCVVFHLASSALDQVDDTDLVHLLTGEDNVITLFTKENCAECDEWETLVDNMQKDLKDALNAIVVKAQHSQLVTIYDPSREPALVYFRRGIPLLYYGERNEDEVMRTFVENKDPVVKELSDENFEHLTQASTGATTGDWFLFFYSADCVFCQRLYAVWEAVGAKLRHRLNVARINRLEAGLSTAKRFGVVESPEFIFLRQGKVYRYKAKKYTPKGFIEFADGGYRQQKHPENVPELPNLINDYLSSQLKAFIEEPRFMFMGVAVVTILVLAVCIVHCMSAKKKKASTKTKKAK